jgi:hypothetical protein
VLNLLQFRVFVQRNAKKPNGQLRRLVRGRVVTIAIGTATLLPLALIVFPADAATSGSNQSTVQVPRDPVRSVTVSPEIGTSFYCPFSIVPSGRCFIGSDVGGRITGGITITNGAAASDIEVNGQTAVPSVSGGKPWTLVNLATTGLDQFDEATEGGPSPMNLLTTPQCDNAFDGTTSSCVAVPNQSREEELVIIGPSSSTGSGTFRITTTWTAVPPP